MRKEIKLLKEEMNENLYITLNPVSIKFLRDL